MTPDDMIQRYAYAVAKRLPRSMQADVRAELHALLHDDIQALAGNDAIPLKLVEERIVAFGPPSEVALRYHRPAPIIELVDAGLFAKLALGLTLGLTVLALSIGVSTSDQTATQLQDGLRDAIFVVLGFLLACFWALGALRRAQPKLFAWKPNKLPAVRDPELISRPLAVSALVAGSVGLLILMDPISFFDLLLGGQSPSTLAHAFTYDQQFLSERAPLLWIMLTFSLLILAFATIEGRWRPTTRKVALGLSLVVALISLWVVLAGPIFVATPTDQSMKFWVALIAGITCVDIWLKWRDLAANGRAPVPKPQ